MLENTRKAYLDPQVSLEDLLKIQSEDDLAHLRSTELRENFLELPFEAIDELAAKSSNEYTNLELKLLNDLILHAENNENQYKKIAYLHKHLALRTITKLELIELAVRGNAKYIVGKELQRDRTRINHAVVTQRTNHGTPKEVCSLLQLALLTERYESVSVLLGFGAQFDLYDEKGSNIFHVLATLNKDDYLYEDALKTIFYYAENKFLQQKNNDDYTPIELAQKNNNKIFLDACKAMQFTIPPEQSQARDTQIMDGFRGTLPKLNFDQMQSAIDGKELKYPVGHTRLKPILFKDRLSVTKHILSEMTKNPHFVLNAVITDQDSFHVYNVLFIGVNTKNIHCIAIDSLGYDYCGYVDDIKYKLLLMRNVDLKILTFSTPIKKSPTGCHEIALYVAGKMARLATYEQALSFFDSIEPKVDSSGRFHLADTPLWLGLHLVCQDSSEIDEALSKMSEDEKRAPFNHYQKPFEDVLAIGKKLTFCPAYTQLQNPTKNATLERKKENQKRHAEAYLKSLKQ